MNKIDDYIKMGPLGEAFVSDEQVVLLIDEIDKADPEFPNDLLQELDVMSFDIPELKKTIEAKHRPIVIITSNNEKELPNAFLRVVVFHFITFRHLTDGPIYSSFRLEEYPWKQSSSTPVYLITAALRAISLIGVFC